MRTALRRTREQDQLTGALVSLAVAGGRPRCGDPDVHNLWISDDPADRSTAATWCAGCPILKECGAAAESVREPFGVWAGIDRTSRATS